MSGSGSYTLEVTSLATMQTLASPAFADSTTTVVGAGSLTFRFGTTSGSSFTEDTSHAAVTVDIPSGSTLSDIAGAINAQQAGVTAYVSQTAQGAQLVLKGPEGAQNGFVVEATETRFRGTFDFKGKDGARTTDEVFDLQGEMLVRREIGEGATMKPFTYTRCQ